MKNLSEGELTKPEMEVLAKGLNFAITPDHVSVADMITATESAIQNNNIPEDEAEQLRAQGSMSLLIATPTTTQSHPTKRHYLAKETTR